MIEILKSKDRALIKLDKLTKGSWVNVISPSSNEIKTLKSKFNIPEEVFSSLKDVDEIPTIERYKDLLFILIKTPQKVEKVTQGKYITIPLGILLTPDYFITICFQDNEIISKFKNSKIYSHKKIQNTLKLLLFSAKNYLKYLKEINKEINNAQKDLEKSMKNKELFNLLDIEKGLIYFNTSLKANHSLIKKLTKRRIFTKYEQDKELLEDVIEENEQAIEMTEIYSNILSGMMDAFASIISNNLNVVMKFLTSITIILMIPTLIASIYGMNISLPLQKSPHAFSLVMLLSLLLSMLGAIIFWRKELF